MASNSTTLALSRACRGAGALLAVLLGTVALARAPAVPAVVPELGTAPLSGFSTYKAPPPLSTPAWRLAPEPSAPGAPVERAPTPAEPAPAAPAPARIEVEKAAPVEPAAPSAPEAPALPAPELQVLVEDAQPVLVARELDDKVARLFGREPAAP